MHALYKTSYKSTGKYTQKISKFLQKEHYCDSQGIIICMELKPIFGETMVQGVVLSCACSVK